MYIMNNVKISWAVRVDPDMLSVVNIFSVEIAIGFSTGSRSLKSDEASGTVTVSVQVLNGTIREGATVSIRFTTADDSAYGRME